MPLEEVGIRSKRFEKGELTIVSYLVLVEDAAMALVHDVGDPDAADGEVVGCADLKKVVPEGFVEFLGLLDGISRIYMQKETRNCVVVEAKAILYQL